MLTAGPRQQADLFRPFEAQFVLPRRVCRTVPHRAATEASPGQHQQPLAQVARQRASTAERGQKQRRRRQQAAKYR